MSKFKVDFAGFEQMRARLNKLEAGLTEEVAIKALEKTNDIVYAAAKAAVAKPNLPAGGKYSRKAKNTESSLREEPLIEQKGTELIAHIGFDMKVSGMTSIWLIRGTPKYPKVQALYDAFYGSAILDKVRQAQREVFQDALTVYENL